MKKLGSYLTLALCLLVTTPVWGQSNPFNGDVYTCQQQETYAGTTYRSATYWQFAADDGNMFDTYVIETVLGKSVCGRLIVNKSANFFVEQMGVSPYMGYSDAYDQRWGKSVCYNTLASQSGAPILSSDMSTPANLAPVSSSLQKDNVSVSLTDPISTLLSPAYPAELVFPLLVPIPRFEIEPYPADSQGFLIRLKLNDLNDPTVSPSAAALGVSIPLNTPAFSEQHIAMLESFYLNSLQPAGEWTIVPGSNKVAPGGGSFTISFQNEKIPYFLNMVFAITSENLIMSVTYEENAKAQVQTVQFSASTIMQAKINEMLADWTTVIPQSIGPNGEMLYYLTNPGENPEFLRVGVMEVGAPDANGEIPIDFYDFNQASCNGEEFLPDWISNP